MSDSVFGIQHKRLRESFAQGHKVSVKVKPTIEAKSFGLSVQFFNP